MYLYRNKQCDQKSLRIHLSDTLMILVVVSLHTWKTKRAVHINGANLTPFWKQLLLDNQNLSESYNSIKLQSEYSIKLLMFTLCCQTPPERSAIDPKPVCYFDPPLPRIFYVAPNLSLSKCLGNIKALIRVLMWKKKTFAAVWRNFSANTNIS